MLHIITSSCIALLLFAAGLVSTAAAGPPALSADEALQRLKEGNTRYSDEKQTAQQRSTAKSRAAVAKSQQPYAVVLTCSDSRVPPELLFDAGLGELFVIRVAGNIPDPVVLGSIEYAAEHLGTPLVLVLGHERCGAVTSAVEGNGKGEGFIAAVLKRLIPAIGKARKECDACKGDKQCAVNKKSEFVECVADANIRLVTAGLTQQSKLLKKLVDQKNLKIISGKYDLDDGKVLFYP